MLWSILFSVGIVQGLFLILVLMLRTGSNPLATRLLIALLLLFMLANVDDLLLSTGWYRLAPGMFGLSMNILFANGVMLWWYIRAITDLWMANFSLAPAG